MVNLVLNSKNSTNQVKKSNLIEKIVSRIQEFDDYDKSNASSSNGFFYSHPVSKQNGFQIVNNYNNNHNNIKCEVNNATIQANNFLSNFSNLSIKNENQKGKNYAFYSPVNIFQ